MILQRLAGPEFRHLGRLDLDSGTRSRVAARPGGPLAYRERAKTRDGHAAALLQGGLDTTDQGFQGAPGGGLGDVSLGGDVFDEFGLVQRSPLSTHPLPVYRAGPDELAHLLSGCASRGRHTVMSAHARARILSPAFPKSRRAASATQIARPAHRQRRSSACGHRLRNGLTNVDSSRTAAKVRRSWRVRIGQRRLDGRQDGVVGRAMAQEVQHEGS